jgi:adenylylsulfate reductase subunit A
MGRTWYAPWSSGFCLCVANTRRRKNDPDGESNRSYAVLRTAMARWVLISLHLKTYTQNGYGEPYEPTWRQTLLRTNGWGLR